MPFFKKAKMKKISTYLLVFMLIFTLSACNSSEAGNKPSSEKTTTMSSNKKVPDVHLRACQLGS
jgi:PBP1b-binding outer membrane lipoprotein LpoB